MKKKLDYRIIIILLLVVVFIGIIIAYRAQYSDETSNYNLETKQKLETSNTTKINTSGEVKSGLTEQLPLHATYYYSEIYVEENKQIAKGENILKYTNGSYLVAPYDCVISSISVPEVNGQCTNKHYIEVLATNILEIDFSVKETNIENISIGQEATVKIEALENTYTGYVTNISNTANNGNFTVKVEIENDGNIKLGMTANVEI